MKIETRMQTKKSSKQHFIPGMNYTNRRLIIIRGNKRSGKMFAFDDTPIRLAFVAGPFLKLLNLVCICGKPVRNWGQICHSLVGDFPVTLLRFYRKKKLACSRRSNAGEWRNLIAIIIERARCMNESRARKTSRFSLTRNVFHSGDDFCRSPLLNTWDRLRKSRSHKVTAGTVYYYQPMTWSFSGNWKGSRCYQV